jgi:hypothetical protein
VSDRISVVSTAMKMAKTTPRRIIVLNSKMTPWWATEWPDVGAR